MALTVLERLSTSPTRLLPSQNDSLPPQDGAQCPKTTLDLPKRAPALPKRLLTSPTWRPPSQKDSRPPQDGAQRLPPPSPPWRPEAPSRLFRRGARRGPFPSKMAAAATFLPLTPGARDPGSGRRRPRGSRNRKKGWKRWAGPEARLGREIGDFLEDVALQQHLKLNKGREKPLRIDLLLRPDSKVPAPKNILAYQVPNGGKERRRRQFWERLEQRGVLPRAERLLRARLRAAAPPREKPLEKGLLDPSRDFYDIWADDNPLDRALAGQDSWFLQETKKQRVKRPPRLQKKPSEVPAVEVIAPGGSYNPTFEDHQETAFREQCEGLLEESGGEEEEEEKEEEEEGGEDPQDPPKVAVAPPRPGKKTEQQRRREKEARALRRRQEAARCRGRQELFRLRALRRQLRRWEAERLRRRQAREAKLRALQGRPRRLGRLKYEDPSLEVQLSEELAESLRTLKPEGSVVHDRFKSLQKRSLIEPRERAKFKRKYRVKYVEKRAFREVT
uniref:Ribosome biogenesis protein NOP53 n=1 Tax=Cairina moschata TaxID=8855 RepID=A0A8C3C958_CAIMO